MKRVNFLVKLVSCFALLMFSACDKYETEQLWSGFGTIISVTDTETMTFLDDKGTTINISGSSSVLSTEYVNKRASILFTRTDENPQDDDDVMNGELEYFAVLPTYDVDYISGAISDEDLFAEYGSKRVTPIEAWIEGGYLNLYHRYHYSETTSVRAVSVVVNYSRIDEDKVYLELYYKEGLYTSEEDYEDFYNETDVLACFNLNDSFAFDDDEKDIVLEFIDIDTDEMATLTLKNDGESVAY